MNYLFTYPNYGTPPCYPEHVEHSGQRCTIVRELGDDDRDEEVGPMYLVKFNDGTELLVMYDELTPRPPTVMHLTDEGWHSGDPNAR